MMQQPGGLRGVFALSWDQVELDGLPASSVDDITLHSVLRWSDEALRLDGPQSVLALGGGTSHAEAARRLVTKMLASIDGTTARAPSTEGEDLRFTSPTLTLTDGQRLFSLVLMPIAAGDGLLLVCQDCLPPVDQDLWVVKLPRAVRNETTPRGNAICFTPGTRILTRVGEVDVADLRAGDTIMTRDHGAQPIEWRAEAHLTKAGLAQAPHLRPVRVRAGALGDDQPEHDLLLSPSHRVLLRRKAALALFSEREVLVAARDLVDRASIHVDHSVEDVRYIHLMMPRHSVIWANGIAVESFHPADMALDDIAPGAREDLLERFPSLARNAYSYGPAARRCLAPAEAAILLQQSGRLY